MPEYSLSEYTTKIAALIQDGQIEEAIAHARHVLSHYPRYLPAYSQLAHASMEKGDLSHASHFFQSILSANPQDADAWMNLAQLSDDLGETEQATWYMERAFEIEPGNNRIRERLRQLYSQRDGVERTRIKLTPAALACTQSRSGSFRRASQKLQRILATAGNLPPLQIATLEVTLAHALWNQTAKADEADDVCGSLLKKLPECLQANLIRARIYADTDRDQEAAPYLDAARELDPEGEFAFKMLGPQSPLPQIRVEIPYLDYQPAQAEPQPAAPEEPEDTSWMDEIDQNIQAATQQEQTQEPPERPAPLVQEAKPQLDTAQPEPTGPAAETEPPVPAWLRQIQQESTQETDQEQDLDWLQEPEQDDSAISPPETVALDLPDGEIPDWLEGLKPIPDEAEAQEPEPESDEEQTLVSSVPDWLLDLGQETDDLEPETTDSELPAPPLPGALDLEHAKAWETDEARPPVPEPEPIQEPEIPDWLQQLEQPADSSVLETAETIAPNPFETQPLRTISEQELDTDQELSLADLGLSDDPERPAWLQELQTEVLGTSAAAPVPPPTVQVEPAPDLAEETVQEEAQEPYEWLSELGVTDEPEREPEDIGELLSPAAELEPALEPTPEEELPDWLIELRSQTGPEMSAEDTTEPIEAEAETETEPLEPSEPEPVAALIPDAMLDLEEPELEQALPEWLQELETEAETETAGDLEPKETPDWLSEPKEEPVPTITVDQMPDWLNRLQSPEAETVDELDLAVPETKEIPEPSLAAPEPEPTTGLDDLEWLQELEQAPEQPFTPEPLPEPPPRPQEPVTAQLPPEPALDAEPALVETSIVSMDDDPLAQARLLLQEGTLDASAQQYESLLVRGDVEQELIVELEEAVQTHPEHSGLQRVLGDAYMQSNQLEQALVAYREALRKL